MTAKPVKKVKKVKKAKSNLEQANAKRKQTTALVNGLEPRVDLFIDHYLESFNGAKAARAVKISDEQAKAWASRMLLRVDVKLEVARRQAAMAKKIEWSIEDQRRELLAIAMADISDIAKTTSAGIQLEDLDGLPPEIRRCIKTVKFGSTNGTRDEPGEVYIKEIILHDRMQALDMLAKNLGFYEKDNEQKGGVVADLLNYLRTSKSSGLPVVK